jgi:hypothetical protein
MTGVVSGQSRRSFSYAEYIGRSDACRLCPAEGLLLASHARTFIVEDGKDVRTPGLEPRCEASMRERASPSTAAAVINFLVLNTPVDPMHAVPVTAGGDSSSGWSYSIVLSILKML